MSGMSSEPSEYRMAEVVCSTPIGAAAQLVGDDPLDERGVHDVEQQQPGNRDADRQHRRHAGHRSAPATPGPTPPTTPPSSERHAQPPGEQRAAGDPGNDAADARSPR